jgi:hypothetical protein
MFQASEVHPDRPVFIDRKNVLNTFTFNSQDGGTMSQIFVMKKTSKECRFSGVEAEGGGAIMCVTLPRHAGEHFA